MHKSSSTAGEQPSDDHARGGRGGAAGTEPVALASQQYGLREFEEAPVERPAVNQPFLIKASPLKSESTRSAPPQRAGSTPPRPPRARTQTPPGRPVRSTSPLPEVTAPVPPPSLVLPLASSLKTNPHTDVSSPLDLPSPLSLTQHSLTIPKNQSEVQFTPLPPQPPQAQPPSSPFVSRLPLRPAQPRNSSSVSDSASHPSLLQNSTSAPCPIPPHPAKVVVALWPREPAPPHISRIVIDNLSFATTRVGLSATLASIGPVQRVDVKLGLRSAVATADFVVPSDAARAVKAFDLAEVEGRIWSVGLASVDDARTRKVITPLAADLGVPPANGAKVKAPPERSRLPSGSLAFVSAGTNFEKLAAAAGGTSAIAPTRPPVPTPTSTGKFDRLQGSSKQTSPLETSRHGAPLVLSSTNRIEIPQRRRRSTSPEQIDRYQPRRRTRSPEYSPEREWPRYRSDSVERDAPRRRRSLSPRRRQPPSFGSRRNYAPPDVRFERRQSTPPPDATQRELDEWARKSWVGRYPATYGVDEGRSPVGRLPPKKDSQWRTQICYFFPPVVGLRACFGRTCDFAHDVSELRGFDGELRSLVPQGLSKYSEDRWAARHPAKRTLLDAVRRSELSEPSREPVPKVAPLPPRMTQLELDILRLKSLDLSLEDIAAMQRIWSSPAANSNLEWFDRTVSFKATFGYLAPSDAACALAQAPAFPDARLQSAYEYFLESQAGQDRAHYLCFIANLVEFNNNNREFARIARDRVREALEDVVEAPYAPEADPTPIRPNRWGPVVVRALERVKPLSFSPRVLAAFSIGDSDVRMDTLTAMRSEARVV